MATAWEFEIIRRILVCLLASLITAIGNAEETRFAVQQWSTRDGLPQNTIVDIAQAPDGALWLATYGGLVRFDGEHFEIEDVASHPDLGTIRLTTLCVDLTGKLCIGTGEGQVLRREGSGWQKILLPDPDGKQISDVLGGADGSLWIARSAGLYRVGPGESQASLIEPGDCRALELGTHGELYASFRSGVIKIDDGEVSRLGTTSANCLAVGGDGRVFASRGSRIIEWNGASWKTLPIDVGLVWDLKVGSSGQLWAVGEQFFGCWTPANATWRQSTDTLKLPPREALISLFEDRDGNLWIGSNTRGLIELSRTPLELISPGEGRAGSLVSVVADRVGSVFVRGERLWRIENGMLVPSLDPPPRAMANASAGGIWLLTENGIELQQTEQRKTVVPAQELPGGHGIILEAGDGSLWLAQAGQLFHWSAPGGSGESVSTFDLVANGANAKSTAIFEDSTGRIWVSGLTSLCILDGDTARVLHSGDEIPLGEIRGFFETPDGAIWIGTYGSGLARINDREITLIDTRRGLHENVVSALIPDGQGHLIVMGNRAVASYSLAELSAVADGEKSMVFGRVFDAGHKVDVFEGNGVGQPRAAIDSNGIVWFPTLQGIARFDPGAMPKLGTPGLVRVDVQVPEPTELSKDAEGDLLYTLSSGHRDVQFRFSAVSFSQPRMVHFRYRLAGRGSEWRAGAGERVVNYKDLPPGNYRFEVEAAIADGPYGARNSNIEIHVPATLFEQTWARAALGMIALLAVFGLGLLRLRSVRTQRSILESRVETRTQELQREVSERKRAEADLRVAGEELELQVEGRTEELLKALNDLERDIRRREELEGRLRESEKFEAVGRLAGGLAHDFNNILTAVLGETDLAEANLLASTNTSDLRKRLAKHLGNVRESGLRAARLTKQLLAYSRQQVMQPEVVDPLATLSDLRSMLLRLVADDIEIVLDGNSESRPILIDPGQLEQVIVNLVVNAAESMPDGGCIQLKCSVVTAPAGKTTTVISVADSGVGLHSEERNRIFEPFFSTKGPARGLGLASVYGIVMQSGGSLDVKSEPGRGTTFSVSLPITESLPAAPSDLPLIAEAHGATVLLVDDDHNVRRVVRSMLEQGGVRVFDVGDPEEALELARSHADELEVLVTDAVMQGMNGKQLSEAVRAIIPSIGVLFISGYSSEVLSERYLLDSGANILAKPFAASILIARVAELVGTRQRKVSSLENE